MKTLNTFPLQNQLIEHYVPNTEAILQEVSATLNKKRADYSPGVDRFSNFRFTNYIARHFPESHKSFAVLVAVKLSRLAELVSRDEPPTNESVHDSFVDLLGYVTLWSEYYNEQQYNKALGIASREEPIR